MSPLFMDTGYEPTSPDSLSAEERGSNTARSDREGEGQQTGNKRQEKNRDAARKSRKKQTERADELHEEFQCLEQSNTALQKEIASLKKDLHLYTTALKRHEPYCLLRASSCMPGSTAQCQNGSSPPLALSSIKAAVSSLSTSLTPGLALQTINCVDGTRLSSPTGPIAATTFASSAGLITSSGSAAVPFSVSFSAVPAPHSLFSPDPPSLITQRPINAVPVCTGLVSNPSPSSSVTPAAQPQPGQGSIQESFPMSADGCLSPLDPAFVMKRSSFLPKAVPLYPQSAAESIGLVAQGSPVNGPPILPGHFRGNPINSSPPLLPPALQALPVSPKANLEPPPAFALKPGYSPPVTATHTSMLSLLTVPSPLNAASPATSISFHGPLSQSPPLLPLLGDPSRDLSLSELLEVNDWILQ